MTAYFPFRELSIDLRIDSLHRPGDGLLGFRVDGPLEQNLESAFVFGAIGERKLFLGFLQIQDVLLQVLNLMDSRECGSVDIDA